MWEDFVNKIIDVDIDRRLLALSIWSTFRLHKEKEEKRRRALKVRWQYPWTNVIGKKNQQKVTQILATYYCFNTFFPLEYSAID